MFSPEPAKDVAEPDSIGGGASSADEWLGKLEDELNKATAGVDGRLTDGKVRGKAAEVDRELDTMKLPAGPPASLPLRARPNGREQGAGAHGWTGYAPTTAVGPETQNFLPGRPTDIRLAGGRADDFPKALHYSLSVDARPLGSPSQVEPGGRSRPASTKGKAVDRGLTRPGELQRACPEAKDLTVSGRGGLAGRSELSRAETRLAIQIWSRRINTEIGDSSRAERTMGWARRVNEAGARCLRDIADDRTWMVKQQSLRELALEEQRVELKTPYWGQAMDDEQRMLCLRSVDDEINAQLEIHRVLFERDLRRWEQDHERQHTRPEKRKRVGSLMEAGLQFMAQQQQQQLESGKSKMDSDFTRRLGLLSQQKVGKRSALVLRDREIKRRLRAPTGPTEEQKLLWKTKMELTKEEWHAYLRVQDLQRRLNRLRLEELDEKRLSTHQMQLVPLTRKRPCALAHRPTVGSMPRSRSLDHPPRQEQFAGRILAAQPVDHAHWLLYLQEQETERKAKLRLLEPNLPKLLEGRGPHKEQERQLIRFGASENQQRPDEPKRQRINEAGTQSLPLLSAREKNPRAKRGRWRHGWRGGKAQGRLDRPFARNALPQPQVTVGHATEPLQPRTNARLVELPVDSPHRQDEISLPPRPWW